MWIFLWMKDKTNIKNILSCKFIRDDVMEGQIYMTPMNHTKVDLTFREAMKCEALLLFRGYQMEQRSQNLLKWDMCRTPRCSINNHDWYEFWQKKGKVWRLMGTRYNVKQICYGAGCGKKWRRVCWTGMEMYIKYHLKIGSTGSDEDRIDR